MHLLASPLGAHGFGPRNLRIHPVEGDGLSPDLYGRRDYVVLATVNRYCGEGIYLVDWGMGPVLYLVQSVGNGNVLMRLTNPLYRSEFTFSLPEFNDMILGYVVADLKLRDETLLRAAVEAN